MPITYFINNQEKKILKVQNMNIENYFKNRSWPKTFQVNFIEKEGNVYLCLSLIYVVKYLLFLFLILLILSTIFYMFVSFLSNGHSPQIHENGELLVRMCRGESHFCQKWPLANVVEFGEYHKWPHFGKCKFGEY